MSELYIQATGAELLYTFEWADVVPAGVTIMDVDYTVPSPLTSFGESPDFDNLKSTVGVKGIAHGGLYIIAAKATLSNAEKVPQSVVVRGFYSGAGA